MEKQTVWFQDLGRMPYQEAWDHQENLLKKNIEVKSDRGFHSATEDQTSVNEEQFTQHHLLFVEHPPVYTLGKSGKMEHVLISEAELQQKGIQFFRTNRGGDITFHGPGQIVGYPIIDLEKFYTDIGRYLRQLEEVVILTLADFGIVAGRSPGETGVWLDAATKGRERKICAMGVRCSRWITMHGFALNVNTDLSYFHHIVPCGIQNKKVTSMQAELGHELQMIDVQERLKHHFEEVFQVSLREEKIISDGISTTLADQKSFPM